MKRPRRDEKGPGPGRGGGVKERGPGRERVELQALRQMGEPKGDHRTRQKNEKNARKGRRGRGGQWASPNVGASGCLTRGTWCRGSRRNNKDNALQKGQSMLYIIISEYVNGPKSLS